MSENQKEPQYKLRWSEELRDKVVESAKLHSRSINAEICTRLEQSFLQNQNDFNAGYNSCMVHMIIAVSKAMSEKGIPWGDVQKTLIDVVDDFQKTANEKKAP
ncbi:Arc family DNA-binding protein [Acinetobacter sp.]|uniref:Arc family DNA-binding protein n=1 Tax=Acinetobacter sp. TaxID=472 RepID=UPI0026472386|nr:Arc family DNA-binding protein [Acinetobacter sp.]MDN5511164.1 Arc family DNA-binding protein [Acinetobacter sp.]MDN5523943.1 Arc family DNA-binding protein [Acinetobacter sp.]